MLPRIVATSFALMSFLSATHAQAQAPTQMSEQQIITKIQAIPCDQIERILSNNQYWTRDTSRQFTAETKTPAPLGIPIIAWNKTAFETLNIRVRSCFSDPSKRSALTSFLKILPGQIQVLQAEIVNAIECRSRVKDSYSLKLQSLADVEPIERRIRDLDSFGRSTFERTVSVSTNACLTRADVDEIRSAWEELKTSAAAEQQRRIDAELQAQRDAVARAQDQEAERRKREADQIAADAKAAEQAALQARKEAEAQRIKDAEQAALDLAEKNKQIAAETAALKQTLAKEEALRAERAKLEEARIAAEIELEKIKRRRLAAQDEERKAQAAREAPLLAERQKTEEQQRVTAAGPQPPMMSPPSSATPAHMPGVADQVQLKADQVCNSKDIKIEVMGHVSDLDAMKKEGISVVDLTDGKGIYDRKNKNLKCEYMFHWSNGEAFRGVYAEEKNSVGQIIYTFTPFP